MSALAPPSAALVACVVVPARDEELLVAGAIRALAGQQAVAHETYEVLLVLDGCTDGTRQAAETAAAAAPGLVLHVLELPPSGVGVARRTGMDLARDRLFALGRAEGLIASTDADSEVAPDWLAAQLEALTAGAEAVGGRVLLDGDGPGAQWRQRSLERRFARLGDAASDEAAEHPHFSGASLGVTARAYARVGGMETRPALEDEAFERALRGAGVPIARPAAVRVRTSARTAGRAPRGLARDLALADWLARRAFPLSPLGPAALAAAKTDSVSVIVPARECAETIGPLVAVLAELRAAGAIDEVLVVDAGSQDGTAAVAAAHGADVAQEDALLADHGPCRGKGDAMWRGLSATSGELVVFVDADTEVFGPGFVAGLLAPLFAHPELELVKGTFSRPFRMGGRVLPDEGGRVTELLARPLLNLHRPELAGFTQPLAGEIAGRRALLEALPFPVGYGVEIAMLIDAADHVGVDALAQADLGVRQNRHQDLRALSAMAYAVLVAASRRVVGAAAVDALAPGPLALPFGELEVCQVPVEERPPLRELLPHVRPQSSATRASRAVLEPFVGPR